MAMELMKFINVYNTISNDKFSFKCVDNTKYEYIIRVLGNYISNIYKKETWKNSVINFPFGGEYIDMSVFKDTKYEKSVENFLELLNKAFKSTIHKEIDDYFKGDSCEFNDTEKQLCLKFYEKISNVKEEIFKETFNNSMPDICSKNSIDKYSDKLKEFDSFVKECSTPLHMNILERFDKVMKKILKDKIHVDIYFDDK
jgi:DNA polymerase III delta prime subunit